MQRGLVLGVVAGIGVVAMAAAGVSAQGQGRGRGPQGPPVAEIQQVADGLYMVTGGGGNTAAYVAAGGVVLVDTKLANWGSAIMDKVRTVTDKPVTHIINTHTHGDHTGSNQDFPASVEIVTHENTKANMERMEVFQQAANRHGLPDRTFTDRMTVLGGNDAIDLYYFGASHTNGDALVVFRNLRVMHAGDMFLGKQQPFIDVNNGGSGLAYGETIGKAAAGIRNVDRVIPGHSTVMTWQDFVNFGEFNRRMLEHARASIKAGRTPEEAMKSFVLPATFSDYNLQGGRGGAGGNFNVMYGELQ
jgi:glyoxylase-like metal-dependent hydrolase (beta-lactamase superfamily II)